MKMLICDIGNSSINFATFSDDVIVYRNHVRHDDFIYSELARLEFDLAAISSVVPIVTEKVIQLLKTQFGIESLLISNESEFLLGIDYDSPQTLGVDRICGAEGALYKFLNDELTDGLRDKEIILTIDCGTATTINVIKSPAIFSGGVIAPGLLTMAKSLSEKTAQLPNVDLNNYKKVIGNDTTSCISSGIINSTLGLIDRVINDIQISGGIIVKTYLTGGNSKYLIPSLNMDFEIENNLVLLGIYSVAKRQIETSKK